MKLISFEEEDRENNRQREKEATNREREMDKLNERENNHLCRMAICLP